VFAFQTERVWLHMPRNCQEQIDVILNDYKDNIEECDSTDERAIVSCYA
jgi:hypothetical protein